MCQFSKRMLLLPLRSRLAKSKPVGKCFELENCPKISPGLEIMAHLLDEPQLSFVMLNL